MIDEPQVPPLGSLIVEFRDDMDVASLVGNRVRGFEPGPEDIQPKQSWRAFVVVSILDAPPDPDVPVTFAQLGVAAYGTTPQNAWAVWGAVVKACHRIGPRFGTGGLGIYQSLVTSGGTQDADPDTKQPLVRGVITLVATAQAVA